jgi:enoyl-CoA hydratase
MTYLEEDTVQLVSTGPVSEIVINRPKSLNALNADVLQGLILALDKLATMPDVRVLTITGAGEKAFVAGADIATMSGLGPRAIADYVELGQRAMRGLELARVPVIAAINGYALGGGLELALACDIIVASRSARLGQPEVNLGVIPGFGGTQRLIQRCGIGAARRLCYTGELITADEGFTIGLVDRVVEAAELKGAVAAMANLIAQKAPLAVQKAKSVIRQSQEGLLNSGLRLEVEGFLSLFGTADRAEGMEAFLQKREPKWRGQ